jgi:hypothetical protein
MQCMGPGREIRFLLGLDTDFLRSSGFCLGQRQYSIGDLRLDMIRVDGGRQAQGPCEGAAGHFTNEVVVIVCLVLAFDAQHILQDLNVQILSIEARHECRKNVRLVFFTDVDLERAFAVLVGAASQLAIRVRVYVKGHSRVLLGR